MDEYEVIGLLGEGSFGRVYKAKQINNSSFVALKIISKRGRSSKELKGLRRECEIQRYLHHPNIIQMLDSFETENEIVVITEFAHKELNSVLGKEGYLPEERVQEIVWDIVSALYYLHSNRVLHRDLKPQNILIDSNNVAKLCDFGFARNMSTGTHVLTSIKGTPLYMAPELIEEQPYDHNADLWSLGCIMYELLVGAPPFCTGSILHLIRLIKHEQIQWPTFVSETCVSFLRGLLQKNPSKRMSWPDILEHPFVKGHITITADEQTMPLTRPFSANTMQLKEQHRNHCIKQKGLKTKSKEEIPTDSTSNTSKSDKLEEKLSKMTVNEHGATPETFEHRPKYLLQFPEDNQPFENEEWVAFLQKNIEEIMQGEVGCLMEPSSTDIMINPLRNSNVSGKVVGYVANLFSLPFVVHGISKETLQKIRLVYQQVKLVPNLIYASKLLSTKNNSAMSSVQSNNSYQEQQQQIQDAKSPQDAIESFMINDNIQTFESVFVLICRLVYEDNVFLDQFCDSIAILRIFGILQQLLGLSNKSPKIVTYLLSIFIHLIRKSPENFNIVEQLLFQQNNELQEKSPIDFKNILKSKSSVVRERTCMFLLVVGKASPKTLESLWNDDMYDVLEALVYDSDESVRNIAELTAEELSSFEFYRPNTS